MNQYLVTFRLAKMSEHDPRRKVAARCRLLENHTCTDQTGEHHTILVNADSIEKIHQHFDIMHITRIEQVEAVMTI